jgi:methyl-accepting chemotaxis protein
MDVSLTNRIVLGSLLIALLSVGGVGGVSYYIASSTVEKMARSEVEGLTDTAYKMVRQSATGAVANHLKSVAEKNREMVARYHRLAETGAMTPQQAKREAEAALLSQTIGRSGYMYCLSSDGTFKVHPRRSLVNVNISEQSFAREQMQRREGYLEYTWKEPDEKDPRAKALYMTYFAPWDWIISVAAYPSELKGVVEMDVLRADVLSITIGDTGYMSIMDGKGTLLVHPKLEGQNIYASRDADGRAFIREMCERKNGTATYSWQNPGELGPREKFVVYKYLADFDWIIAGGTYRDELDAPLRRVRSAVAGLLIAMGGVALGSSLLLGRAMGRSFSALEGVASRVARGDLRDDGAAGGSSSPLPTAPREIRAVEHAFGGMARSLGKIVRGIAGMSGELSGSVATVSADTQEMVGASTRQLAVVTKVVETLEGVSASVLSTHGSIAELDAAAEQGASSTSQLSQGLDALSAQVTQFSAFVEQTGATIKQMAEVATHIEANTSEVSQAAERSSESASELERSIRSIDSTTKESEILTQAVTERAHAGRSAVARSIEGMSHIAVTFEAIDKAVASLGERVAAIKDIVHVIEEISDQTKLVALNAAILAAQAGEQGGGFSVVADEIKRLSDRTDSATGEIVTLISSADQEGEHTSSVMAVGLKSVREGHKLAADAGQAIASILGLTEQSHAHVTLIAAATREQVHGNKSIMQSVAQIAAMSRGVLELTAKQHGFAAEIKTGVDTVLRSLAAVRRSIEEEALGSKDVAQQISTISSMSSAIRRDSERQRAASEQMVRDIEVIKGSAACILGRAVKVAGSLSPLSSRVADLNAALARFTVDGPGGAEEPAPSEGPRVTDLS